MMDLTTLVMRAVGILIAVPLLCLAGYLVSFAITGGVLSAKDAHRKRSQCGDGNGNGNSNDKQEG